MNKLQLGINQVTNSEYHSDQEYLSSSKLKLLITDTEKFYKEVVLGLKPPEPDKPAFAEGSYVHTLVLEPEKVQAEYQFFDGWRKQGSDWTKFLETANPSKRILSAPQKHRCETWAASIKKRLKQIDLLKSGLPEHTLCAILHNVKVKIRADWINVEAGYIADVKTTGDMSDLELFKFTIEKYYYQLSAALYCLVAELVYGKPFDFYFIVVSKTDGFTEVYKCSPITMQNGKLMVLEALRKLRECEKTGIWANNVPKLAQVETGLYEIKEV